MSQKTSEYSVSVPKLMSALRDLMAKERTALHRVRAVLTLLCEQLAMPTSVLYVMRPGDVLEQFTSCSGM